MTIGEKIKYLRQKNDVTQEKLAEYLNISYQSVSKWENNNAMPDIALVVPLANFFGVTIDELFDRDAEEQLAETEEYNKKDYELKNKGIIAERISLWRSAVQKYPRNHHFLLSLADALNDTLYRDEFKAAWEENAKELIAICERILRDCTDNNLNAMAIRQLVYTYACPWISVADEEKAVEYALKANSMYYSSDILLEQAYFTEASKDKKEKKRQENMLDCMDLLTTNIMYANYATAEERIFACETAEKLWKTLIYDDNFLFYHHRLARIHQELACNYAKLENRDGVIKHLRLALHHASRSDNQPEGDLHYTSVFLKNITSNRRNTSKNFQETETELVKNDIMANEVYNFIRGDDELIELLNG